MLKMYQSGNSQFIQPLFGRTVTTSNLFSLAKLKYKKMNRNLIELENAAPFSNIYDSHYSNLIEKIPCREMFGNGRLGRFTFGKRIVFVSNRMDWDCWTL